MASSRRIPTFLGLVATVLAVGWGAAVATAQPLAGRILDDVAVSGRCLTVTFSFPLQYVRHFPFKSGRVDGDALFGREVARPPGREALHHPRRPQQGV